MSLKESLSIILDKNNKVNWKKTINNAELINNLHFMYPDINLNEICYRILNDDNVDDKCKNCTKKTRFISNNEGFGSFCCKKCSNEYNAKLESIKQKRINTNMKKSNQNHSFNMNDSIRSMKKYKEFFINNEKIICKTIEKQVIEYFIKAGITIKEFQIDKSSLPIINYLHQNKSHTYFPSLYIKSRNMIIDVKNTYYFDKNSDQNISKQLACKDQGFHHIFILMSSKNKIDQII